MDRLCGALAGRAASSPRRWLQTLLFAAVAFIIGGLMRELYSESAAGWRTTMEVSESFPRRADEDAIIGARHVLDMNRHLGSTVAEPAQSEARIKEARSTAVGSTTEDNFTSASHQTRPTLVERAKCVLRVNANLGQWISCIKKTPANDNALAWKDKNTCGFTRHLYRDYDEEDLGEGPGGPGGGLRLRRLLASSVLEFQGDSTLREVVSLLVSQAGVPGALEKKDAHKGLRTPKYFVKLGPLSLVLSNPSLSPTTTNSENLGGVLARFVFRFDFLSLSLSESWVNVPLVTIAANSESQSFGDLKSGASSAQTSLSLGFFDPIVGSASDGHTSPLRLDGDNEVLHKRRTSACTGSSVRSGNSAGASNGTPKNMLYVPPHIVVVSLASHGAKHLVTEARLEGTEVAANKDYLFRFFTGALEDYLLYRVLGIYVKRGEGEQIPTPAAKLSDSPAPKEEVLLGPLIRLVRPRARNNSLGKERDGRLDTDTQRIVTSALVVGQSFECSAMAAAPNKNFRRMAPQCQSMEAIVRSVWRLWSTQSMAFLRAHAEFEVRTHQGVHSSDAAHSHRHQTTELLHNASSWRHITEKEALRLAAAVAYLPPLYCHGEEASEVRSDTKFNADDDFRYEPSRPYCTRDGIHLRKKYLVQKLDAVLNAIIATEEC